MNGCKHSNIVGNKKSRREMEVGRAWITILSMGRGGRGEKTSNGDQVEALIYAHA